MKYCDGYYLLRQNGAGVWGWQPPSRSESATAPGRAHDTGTVYKCALSEISDKAHYPRRKIIREAKWEAGLRGAAAGRLGIRGGDIATLTFEELDLKRNTICLTQQKTAAPLALPMLPEIKAALLDYLEYERASSDSEYVFLSLKPPFSHISVQLLGKLASTAIRSAGIILGGRKCGPHAFRASLASSMVNDDVPYEVVRNTLGHTDVNAIKSYAKLDVERLRVYALAVPEAAGYFAKFLSGGRDNR